MNSHPSRTVIAKLSDQTKSRLAEFAEQTQRTKSALAEEAITDYVERELAVIAGMHRGLADMEAACVTPHEEAMKRIRRAIAGAGEGM